MSIVERDYEGQELSRDIVQRKAESINLYLFHNIKYIIKGIDREWTVSCVGTSRDEVFDLLRQKAKSPIEIKDSGNQIELHGFTDTVLIYLVSKYKNDVERVLKQDKKLREHILNTVIKPPNVSIEKPKSWVLF